MKNVFLYLLFIFAIVALFGVAFSNAQENESEGAKIFVDNKCSMCHSVESAGITSKKKDAVDLSVTGQDKTAEFLIKYLKKEEKIDDKMHKSTFKGSDEELKVLSEWLAGLKDTE